jgi:predicted lipoprotein with Yx(FWY)xxD motif
MNIKYALIGIGIGGAALLATAACSSSSGSSSPGTPASAGGTTVAVRSVSGTGNVLTDTQGHTLYASEQEANGKLMCTSSACNTFWQPLLVADGKPTGPSSLTAKLTTVTRPDGKMQVALNGSPLYTFTEDHSAGQISGNGFKDSFGSQHFTWHVATPAGIASGAPSSPGSGGYSSSGGYGGGGGGGY